MGVANKTIEQAERQSDTVFEKYAIFRANLRLLRYTTDFSADRLGKELGFQKHYRIRMLEEGRGMPVRLDELEALAKFFKQPLEHLLYKKAKIVFE